MNNNITEEILTVRDVASMFRVKETTIRDWAKRGTITGKRVGRKWFFNKNSIWNYEGGEK